MTTAPDDDRVAAGPPTPDDDTPPTDSPVLRLAAGLRDLGSLRGSAPTWDAELEDDPVTRFAVWVQEAIEAGVEEPHAMVLSTQGEDGIPDARVLILKDLRPEGRWVFASSAGSTKSRQLEQHPRAALTFYWPERLRSVRVRGTVERAGQDVAEADFAQRSPGARAVATAGVPGQEMVEPGDQQQAVAAARQRIENGEDIDHDWAVWWLHATEIEFWQGSPDRQHRRLRHRRTADGWVAHRLWS